MATSRAAGDVVRVVLAGPNGTLGEPIIKAFLNDPTFHLTLLTRSPTKTQNLLDNIAKQNSSLDTSNSQIKPIDDYDNTASLTSALTDQDALIILLNRAILTEQIALIDAAIAAGVKHIIPSSFGVGTTDPYIRASPPVKEKVAMEDHLLSAIANQPDSGHGKTTFTCVNTGLFMELGFRFGVGVNLKSAVDDQVKTVVYDEGEMEFAVTAHADIALATKNAVRLAFSGDEGETGMVRDKVLFVQTMSVTQQQLLKTAKELRPRKEWGVTRVDTEEMEQRSWEAYQKGERGMMVMQGFMAAGTFRHGLGRFERVDNGVLGVRGVDGEGVKGVLEAMIGGLEREKA